MSFPLTILAGQTACAKLAEDGWQPELFKTLIGASGGAKMLGLVHLDRFLFGDYLQRSAHSMSLYGSSIGSWRHAALACPDPLNAVTTLQERYLNQTWEEDDPRSPGEIVDELCEWVLQGFLDEDAKAYVCNNQRFTTHIVTAKGLGLNGHARSLKLILGMGTAAMGNLISRRWLQSGFQRVTFSSDESSEFNFSDFNSIHTPLTPENLTEALLASGSIPFLMSGQRDIPGAPDGHYWDGGVIDYHFDLSNLNGDGLILYPHFTHKIIPGWFDKGLVWRHDQSSLMDRVVLLAPSKDYLEALPYGKIPDRKDFQKLGKADRLNYWNEAVAASQQLAEGCIEAIEATDPLKFVTQVS